MSRSAASNASNPPRAAATLWRTAMLLLAIILTGAASPARAQDPSPPLRSEQIADARRTAADLEHAFWACDYAAMTRWIGAGEGAQCSAVFEEIKASRFRGDFRSLLAWWQQHKEAEHRSIAAKQAGNRATP